MEKCRLLEYILEYTIRKKHYFDYNDILKYIIFKDREAYLTTIERQIRYLEHQGFLIGKTTMFSKKYFYPVKTKIKEYLYQNCKK